MASDCPRVVGALGQLGWQSLSETVSTGCGIVEPYWILLGGLAVVCGALYRFGKPLWTFVAPYIRRVPAAFSVLAGKVPQAASNGLPPLTFVVDPNQTFWGMGKQGDAPVMSVALRGNVSNLGGAGALLLHVELSGYALTWGMIMVKDSESAYHGRYVIPPGHMTDFTATCIISPPTLREGQEFTTTVIVIDNYARRHAIPNVRFKFR